MYKCAHCPYSTDVKCNFIRHKNRKRKCYKYIPNVMVGEPNVMVGDMNGKPNVMVGEQNVMVGEQNVMVKSDSDDNDDNMVLKCEKCNKIFTRQSSLTKHMESCNGLSKLQCEICHKFFKNRQGKYEHKNNVKCYPPPLTLTDNQSHERTPCVLQHPPEGKQQNIPTQAQSNPTTVNNHGSHNTNNIQNTNNINNNNTTVLMFGKEDLSKLLDNPDYMHKAATLVNSREYFLPMSVPLIYFNDEHEENKTLRKNLRNGNMVEYHIGNGVWEKKFTCDIINDIVDKSCEYISKYLEQVNIKNDIKFSQLRLFGDMLQKFKTTDTGDLEERLIKARKGMSMSSNRSFTEFSEPSSSEIKRTTKKAIALVNDKLYDETQIQKNKEKEKQSMVNSIV